MEGVEAVTPERHTWTLRSPSKAALQGAQGSGAGGEPDLPLLSAGRGPGRGGGEAVPAQAALRAVLVAGAGRRVLHDAAGLPLLRDVRAPGP